MSGRFRSRVQPQAPVVGAPPPINIPQGYNVNPGHVAVESPAQAHATSPYGPGENPYLVKLTAAEQVAHDKTMNAAALSAAAVSSHSGYDAAYGAIDGALFAWEDVAAVVDKLAKADQWQGNDQNTAWMHEAKLALPGTITKMGAARADLHQAHSVVSADQAMNRPDLPPAPAPGESTSASPLLYALALAAAFVLYRVVF